MVKKKKKELQRKTLLLSVTISLLLLSLIVVTYQLADLRSKNSELKKEADAITELLTVDPGVRGRSCGVLHSQRAVDTLGTDELRLRFTNGPVDNKVNPQNSSLHWLDSCRYGAIKSSAVYIELFIETFQTSEDAKNELANDLPKVGTEAVETTKYDELYYSSGAWFARNGEIVVKVSANNGGGSIDLFEFSKSVFDSLIAEII